MVVHVVAESNLTVCLLLARNATVLHLLHEHYLLVFISYEHKHAGCKESATERVLSEEREGAKVGHVGVEHNERDATLMELVRKLSRRFKIYRHDNDAVNLAVKTFGVFFFKRLVVETLVKKHLNAYVEVATRLDGFLHALLHLFPVGFALMLGNKQGKLVCAVVGKRTGVNVWLIIHLFERTLNLLACRLRHVRTVV